MTSFVCVVEATRLAFVPARMTCNVAKELPRSALDTVTTRPVLGLHSVHEVGDKFPFDGLLNVA
jgi:hypothetical protein